MAYMFKARRATMRSVRLTSACVAVLAFAAGAAHAQDQSDQQQTADTAKQAPSSVEEVVVTGIRKSLQDSIAAKRKATEIIEVVSAEDIGKLPDVSIADSLTRLPGLAGQRVGGRYQNISIRGLSPDFTSTLLNGFQQASTGDNRAAEFDQYPSELVGALVVYKTPDPSLVGNGLAGTVDMHTLNPLDMHKRTFAVSARGSWNDQGALNAGAKTTGSRLSGAYIDQFFDGKVGVALGVAHLDAPESERHYQTWWWANQGGLTPAHPEALGAQGAEAYAFSRDVKRDGVMATVEFKPTENFHSINNVFWSKFRQAELMHGEEWIEGGNSDGNQTITNPVFETIRGQVFNTGGTIDEIVPILISKYNTRNEDQLSFITRNTWDVGGWNLGADFSYSNAVRKESQMEQYAQYGPTPTWDTITFSDTATTSGFPQAHPGLDYSDASQIYLDCPSPWGGCWGHDGLLHNPTTKDTFTEGKVHARHDITGFGSDIFSDFEVGADYATRVKRKTEDDKNLFLNGSLTNGVFDPNFTMLLPSDVLTGNTDLSWAGWGPLVGYDPRKAMKYYTAVPIEDSNQFDKNWEDREKLTTLYGKLNIRSEVFGLPLTGNLGLQYVYAQQESDGFQTSWDAQGNVVFAPYTGGANFSNFLPSVNLKLELPHYQYIHFGYAREMSRPRLDDLRANSSGWATLPTDPVTQQPCSPGPANPSCLAGFQGGGGNPKLAPWLADAFDLTYSWYPTKGSFIAVQAYYKDLKSYIFTQITPNYNFTGYPNPLGYPIGSPYGPFEQPANGKGGYVKGLELSGTLEGSLATHWLDGFGITGSVTKAWTDVLENGPAILENGDANPYYDPTIPLAGFSGTVASWTVFYEKHGFSARLSHRYRTPYRGRVGGLFANKEYVLIGADRALDAQVSYDFTRGRLKGLTLLAQGYNLTNEPYIQYASGSLFGASITDPTNLKYYKDYGRTFLVGFNYKW